MYSRVLDLYIYACVFAYGNTHKHMYICTCICMYNVKCAYGYASNFEEHEALEIEAAKWKANVFRGLGFRNA